MKRTLKAFAFHLAVISGLRSRLPKLHKQKTQQIEGFHCLHKATVSAH